MAESQSSELVERRLRNMIATLHTKASHIQCIEFYIESVMEGITSEAISLGTEKETNTAAAILLQKALGFTADTRTTLTRICTQLQRMLDHQRDTESDARERRHAHSRILPGITFLQRNPELVGIVHKILCEVCHIPAAREYVENRVDKLRTTGDGQSIPHNFKLNIVPTLVNEFEDEYHWPKGLIKSKTTVFKLERLMVEMKYPAPRHPRPMSTGHE